MKPDYKSMYFHMAGRMATTVDVLETTVKMLGKVSDELEVLVEKLKQAQLTTEEMYAVADED
ncbi:MAG: hypothetical protein FWB93_00295 [Oscillospiraceae bacterium]|nr:hypothetical protein [Oscillospiraceae bacterium]